MLLALLGLPRRPGSFSSIHAVVDALIAPSTLIFLKLFIGLFRAVLDMSCSLVGGLYLVYLLRTT